MEDHSGWHAFDTRAGGPASCRHFNVPMEATPGLFIPLKLRDAELRNRIIVSPMCQYSAEKGFPTDWHRVHYGSRAVGGAGMVILEATAVTPEGRISWADLGIWDDAHAAALGELAGLIETGGAVPAVQLAHAGRKAATERPWKGPEPETNRIWPIVSSTSVPFSDGSQAPHRLNPKEIGDLVEAFAAAAGRAVNTGFRAVEIHAAHGYLLHQFLSPLCNDRDDGYGGTFDGRTRLLREIVTEVRRTIPAGVPVLVRVSATDWKDGGWTIEDTVRLAAGLKDLGADFIDCSSGGIAPGIRIPAVPGYQVEFAAAVRNGSGLPSGAVGLITESRQAEDILASGKADAVLLAREMLRDPYWLRRAAAQLGKQISAPSPYMRAW